MAEAWHLFDPGAAERGGGLAGDRQRMNAIRPLCGFTFAAPTAVAVSAGEAVPDVAVPAAGSLVAELPGLHAVRLNPVSTQMAPSAATIPRIIDPPP